MPILMHRENLPAIRDRRKTVTRRRWKRPMVKTGGIYQIRTKIFGEPFARVRVLDVAAELRPGLIAPGGLEAEAHREGFETWLEFEFVWISMHGPNTLNEPCTRIEFELVEWIG